MWHSHPDLWQSRASLYEAPPHVYPRTNQPYRAADLRKALDFTLVMGCHCPRNNMAPMTLGSASQVPSAGVIKGGGMAAQFSQGE